jgi:hypothetical protein
MVGKPYLTELGKVCPSSGHNRRLVDRGFHLVQSYAMDLVCFRGLNPPQNGPHAGVAFSCLKVLATEAVSRNAWEVKRGTMLMFCSLIRNLGYACTVNVSDGPDF